jgi:hypothetical protein
LREEQASTSTSSNAHISKVERRCTRNRREKTKNKPFQPSPYLLWSFGARKSASRRVSCKAFPLLAVWCFRDPESYYTPGRHLQIVGCITARFAGSHRLEFVRFARVLRAFPLYYFPSIVLHAHWWKVIHHWSALANPSQSHQSLIHSFFYLLFPPSP